MYDVLLIANLLLWLGLVAHFVTRPYASVFHPALYYLFFHGFIFVFRPFLVYYRDYDTIYRAYQFVPSLDDKATVLIAAMLGLLCFYVPAVVNGHVAPRFPQDRANEVERRELIQPFLFAAALLVPLGLISVLANWNSTATEGSTMVLDAGTGHTINTSGNGYFDDMQLFLAPMTVMCVWLYRFKWWTFLPLVAFIVLRGGTGGRWPIIMASATMALLFLYERRKSWPDWRAALAAAGALAVFQIVGADRGKSIRELFIEDRSVGDYYSQQSVAELRFLEGMDFANLEYFEYLVYAVPQRTGTYGFFLDNLQLLTQPIPRALWVGKPIGPPIQLFSLFDYGYPIGMTYSLPGNGWVQLGYLGVAIWCALFGWLFGWAYTKFQRTLHGNPLVLVYLLFLPLSLQFFRDGLLLTLVQTTVFFLFPVWLVVRMARLSAVPLADELRLRALRKLARHRADVAPKISAREQVLRRRARQRALVDRLTE
ncbi:MAG: O-antigen polymerase [Novosphingobium sp.]